MQIDIPNEEVEGFLKKFKQLMNETQIFSSDTIEKTKLMVIHPENWELSLLVPYENKLSGVKERKSIEKILFETCGVDEMCCDYFGKQTSKGAYEWYFRHPNTPDDICERLEAEIEEELGDEIGMGLPTPRGFKSKNDIVFMTLKDEYYNAIESREKTIEYRNLNQYYCDKLLSPGVEKKFIKFNRGYKSGKENQMVFEIRDIMLVSDRWEVVPAKDNKGKAITSFDKLPLRFAPAMYAIVLGKRIE